VQYRPVTHDDPILTLRAGDVVVTVDPTAGCRIGQIEVGDQPLLVDPPAGETADPMLWGSYPMAPWAGRIRNGRFTFGGIEHRLPINHRDGDGPERAHAIHGLVFDRAWPTPVLTSASSCSATIPLAWEFGGTASQVIAVFDDRVVVTLTLESTGTDFPAEIGWHPWFRKPDRLEFSPTAMYERDEFGLPTGSLVEPTRAPWDDCFIVPGPVELVYDRPTAPVVRVASGSDHVVVFDHMAHATCVEPQSGPPDAFNLAPHVVTSGTPLTLRMTISW